MREVLEKKIEILYNANRQSELLQEYRERVIEKEVKVACGKSTNGDCELS